MKSKNRLRKSKVEIRSSKKSSCNILASYFCEDEKLFFLNSGNKNHLKYIRRLISNLNIIIAVS